jgi:glycosyltransferase involved in cell wall biosynthesis
MSRVLVLCCEFFYFREIVKPFFSIVTPSFNQGAYLTGCLDSIKAQREGSYEHIIVDNCSSDGSKRILEDYATDRRVRLLIEPDRGQSDAINKGFAMAQGEIICWLNSDDAYLPDTFSKLREAFHDPGCQVIFGDVLQVSYAAKDRIRAVARFEDRSDFIRWWSGRIKLHQPAVFFRRVVRENIGFLKEELHYAMDYDYWWRMSEEYHFHYLSELLAIQHRQPSSKTMRSWHSVLEEREKIFARYYPLLDQKKSALARERSQSLASHFLQQAYSAIERDRVGAWFYLKKALYQSPQIVFRPASLGLIKQLICL